MSVWNKESDFYLTVDYDLPEYDPAFVSKSKTLLVSAIIISLLVHWFFLLFKPQHSSSVPAISPGKSVEVVLTQIQSVQEKIETKDIVKNQPVVESKIAKAPKTDRVITTSNVTHAKEQSVHKPIEWLSAEDYKHISEADDKRFDAQDSLAFNPGLKRHRNETRHPSQIAVDGKSIAIKRDIHGNQFYKANGNCFMSLPQSVTANKREGKNWYSVACGEQSGGEKMMDNVNREMRDRFKNP